MRPCIPGSVTCNSQGMEATYVPVSKRLDQEGVVDTMEHYFAIKKNESYH